MRVTLFSFSSLVCSGPLCQRRSRPRQIAHMWRMAARERVVDIEEVIRYFVVHNFVLNFDSYTGSMIHNYYLYEEKTKDKGVVCARAYVGIW